MDFRNLGDSYVEHWVNEYWDFGGNRWVLADVDGYYEYEERFGTASLICRGTSLSLHRKHGWD